LPPYVIDTSIWIRIWRNHPPDIFVNLWQQLDASIAAIQVRSPEEVLHELERGTDDIAESLRQRHGLFAPLDEALISAVTEVQAECDDLADQEGERNRADPFVVGLGKVLNSTVVTDERPRRDPNARRRIPDACDHLHVPWRNWFDFLREVGWQL
jgi:hypothetical protein